MCSPFGEMDSLLKVLESNELPITLSVKGDCVYKGNTVLRDGQFLTIIDREDVSLVCGQDWNGKSFRVTLDNTISRINEYYPKTLADISTFGKKVSSYLMAKEKFGYEAIICDAGDTFIYLEEQLGNAESDSADIKLSFRRTSDQKLVHFPVQILMDPALFVFVAVQEKMNLSKVTEKMLPQKAIFVETVNMPPGVVVLQSREVYDTILSATLSSKDTIRYEMFSLDSRIKVKKWESLPKIIKELGQRFSEQYQNHIDGIKFLLHYDIYSSRFYGSVIMDNPYYFNDSHLESKPSPFHQQASRSITLPLSTTSFNLQRRTNIKETSGLHVRQKKDSREVKLQRTLSDSEVATRIVTMESRIENKTEILQMQEKIYEEYKNQKQQQLLEQEKSQLEVCTQSLERENPLYGYDTLALNAISSKSIPSSESFKQFDMTVGLHNGENEAGAFSLEGDDSGIESPDNRKSLDNIYNMFRLKLSENVGPVEEDEIQSCSSLSARNQKSKKPSIKLKLTTQAKPGSESQSAVEPSLYLQKNQKIDVDFGNNLENSVNKAGENKQSDAETAIKLRRKKKKLTIRSRRKSEPMLDTKGIFNQYHSHETELNFRDVEHEYASLIYSRMTTTPRFHDDSQKKEIESITEIEAFSMDQVQCLLTELKLSKYVSIFKTEMINGKLLARLDEENDMVATLGMTRFEARKLHKYIRGWRLKKEDVTDTKKCEAETWSSNNVSSELYEINLVKLASFCAEYDIDGALLIDLINHNYIKSLAEHDVCLNSIENKRLCSYIKKELNYNEDEKRRSRCR
ncbi:uncharacterized protein LOC130649227 [Hydractinia symbiolongicarpus]|uniref:uncharacterized protein LOC130649227 n=1 Tax=Hydractinia symbiolongicarpus TaxID=13093 RepID=UPI00254BA76C|nr:uncharacterized protein LOC130649227 [Hydractinia symbiolongicarpus]XP_057311460.1 uncharacterized protein LOC130649227 [Hydractinia symbiolongicarpus]